MSPIKGPVTWDHLSLIRQAATLHRWAKVLRRHTDPSGWPQRHANTLDRQAAEIVQRICKP